ncbi:type I restriction enzyme, S subunit [Porphyromonadaceae bacterium NLAE-zl-C104]|nr:type I restriction enzyme, S subunit [Porphyromonadaceae bacterium NLAE-zl-C104]
MSEWKETDFGKIPNHWDLKKIIDIKSEDKRAIAMGPFGSNIKAENFVEKGVPVIRGTNLNYPKYVDGDFVYLTESKADELAGSNCKAGDLVFTHRGTIGQVGLVPDKYPRYVISQSGMKLTVNPLLINNEFLFYFFKSEYGQYQILKYESQVGVPSISNPLTSLKEIEVPCPPLSEQTSIASILSSLDHKIDLLHRQNATLEKIAETLFRKWFVEDVKEEWEMGKLGDEFDFTMGASPPGESYNEEGIGIPMYQGNADFGFRFPVNRVFTTDPKRFAEKYDTLISVRAPVGEQNMANERCCIGRGVAAFRFKKDNSFYTYTYYKMKSLMDGIKQFNETGTVFGSISKTDFEALDIVIPDNGTIEMFQDNVRDIDNKILLNSEQIYTLTSLRDILLPKLMNGEVQINRHYIN